MSAFKNMKIEINESQSFDDIVGTLEVIGYRKRVGAHFSEIQGSYLIATEYGMVTWCSNMLINKLWSEHETVTLTQLKDMK